MSYGLPLEGVSATGLKEAAELKAKATPAALAWKTGQKYHEKGPAFLGSGAFPGGLITAGCILPS